MWERLNTVIVGAGLAGLAAARVLAAAGRGVVLLDKGAKPGGRLASRRMGEVFNHGCQFFTLRDAGFAEVMRAAGAQPWPAAGAGCFAGVPDMAAPAEFLAAGLEVRLGQAVTGVARVDGVWHMQFAGQVLQAETLILAIPAPQAVALLPALAPALASVRMEPCWTVMAAVAAEGPDVLRPEAGPLGWVARENARPGGQGAARYTMQAAAAWSAAHLEAGPEAVAAALTAAFTALTGLPVLAARAHRWRYALASQPLGAPFMWDAAQLLGLCGDWCLAGRLEAAFLSGQGLGIRILHDQ